MNNCKKLKFLKNKSQKKETLSALKKMCQVIEFITLYFLNYKLYTF